MQIQEHLDKENLHHAYLIEGARDEIVPAIFGFFEDLGIKTTGNSDFIHINLDSFKIDDAHNLKSYGTQKSFSSAKRIFIVSANNVLLEAQNSLLKMFEEPIENTHFFLIVPDTNALLKTLVSRFYLIKGETKSNREMEEIKKFITMSLQNRIDYIKELLPKTEKEDVPTEVGKDLSLDSNRSKALKFLNALEFTLHEKMSKTVFDIGIFEHIFKVRELLRMPSSSAKTLLESVALIIPEGKG